MADTGAVGAPDVPPPAPPTNDLISSLSPSLSSTNKSISRLSALLSRTSGLDTSLLATYYPLILLLSLPRQAPSPRLRALADLISDVRIFLRLPGLLGIYLWALSTHTHPPKDDIIRAITWAQVASSAVFQAFENVAYLAQHGIIKLEGKTRGKAWLWSARAWAAHVFLDLARLARQRQLRQAEAQSSTDVEKEDKIANRAESEKWWREVIVNSAYAPMTVHYSLASGMASETWIGVLGSVAGVMGWRNQWRNTA